MRHRRTGTGPNPFDGGLYAFTNRRHNKCKYLYREDNGFVLYYKSLAEEKFRWPREGELRTAVCDHRPHTTHALGHIAYYQ